MTEKLELKGTLKSSDVKGTLLGATGPQGPQGPRGEKGDPGNDGFSPVVTATQNDQGVLIEITDASGTSSAQVYNGVTQDLSNYYTKSEVNSAIDDAISSIVDGDEVSY